MGVATTLCRPCYAVKPNRRMVISFTGFLLSNCLWIFIHSLQFPNNGSQGPAASTNACEGVGVKSPYKLSKDDGTPYIVCGFPSYALGWRVTSSILGCIFCGSFIMALIKRKSWMFLMTLTSMILSTFAFITMVIDANAVVQGHTFCKDLVNALGQISSDFSCDTAPFDATVIWDVLIAIFWAILAFFMQRYRKTDDYTEI